MGARQSKQPGVQWGNILTLCGIITEIYESTVNSREPSWDEGRLIIQHHLKRMAPHRLEPQKPTNYKIFPKNEPLVEITERYRDIDGRHAWSLVIQLSSQGEIYKLLRGVPTRGQDTPKREPHPDDYIRGYDQDSTQSRPARSTQRGYPPADQRSYSYEPPRMDTTPRGHIDIMSAHPQTAPQMSYEPYQGVNRPLGNDQKDLVEFTLNTMS